MFLKRNVIDPMIDEGIKKFILIGENLMMFHGSEDDYYEEWFEEVEEGWIAAINFRYFIRDELCRHNLDNYINFGGNLNIVNWRTMTPLTIFKAIDHLITRRLNA